jgi:hypothetical protein
LLGSEGSGKTCFLAGLAVLAEPNRRTHITVTPTDTVTVEYLDELARTLRCQQWPPPTNMTTILNMKIGLGGTAIDVLMVDYPGEDFRKELRKLNREQVKDLYEHYAEAEATLLLFDPVRDVRAVNDPAHREEQIERQTAHLNAIALEWAERSGQPLSRQARSVDVAIIVTKSDREPGLSTCSATRRFFRKYAAPLDAKICQQAHAVQYFPLSAIGHAASVQREGETELVPGKDLDPKGYEEILCWVLQRRRWRRQRPWVRRGAAAAIAVLFIGLAAWGWRLANRFEAVATLNSPRLSTVEKLERTQGSSDATVLQRRATIFTEELESLKKNLESAASEPSVDEVAQRAARIAALKPGAMQTRVDALAHDCRQKKEDILYRKAADAFNGRAADFPDLSGRFLREYPASSQCDKVREMISGFRSREEKDDRQRIKQIRIISAGSLAEKGKSISEFVAKHQAALPADEMKRMRRAADLARRFSELNTYSVKLKQTGGLTAAYSQEVVLYVDAKELKEYRSPGKSTEVNWDDEDVRIQWIAGQTVRVTWRKLWSAGSWGNSDIATLRDDGPVALRILGGQQPLTRIESGWEKYCNNAFVHFEVDGISEDDWKSLDLYLFPGDGW